MPWPGEATLTLPGLALVTSSAQARMNACRDRGLREAGPAHAARLACACGSLRSEQVVHQQRARC